MLAEDGAAEATEAAELQASETAAGVVLGTKVGVTLAAVVVAVVAGASVVAADDSSDHECSHPPCQLPQLSELLAAVGAPPVTVSVLVTTSLTVTQERFWRGVARAMDAMKDAAMMVDFMLTD